jgi:phosphonatase-like hydrolase
MNLTEGVSIEPSMGRLALVCFDMAGTTVDDGPAVMQCFAAAADELALAGERREEAMAYAQATMGQSKIEVFRAIFGDEEQAQRANTAFEVAYDEVVARGDLRPMPGAAEAFDWCADHGLSIALTTGFSPATRDAILASLGWTDRADLVLSPADAGRGRPYPDMILAAILRLEVESVQQVVVVGDTASDLWSGRRAGASVIVGVLTGAHGRKELETAPATDIIESVATLPLVLAEYLDS